MRDPRVASTLAARLARLDRRLGQADREELAGLAGGLGLHDIARGIIEALDPDRQIAHASGAGSPEPAPEALASAARELVDAALAPLATNPDLRRRIVEVRRSYEHAIDETSKDEVIAAGYSQDATDRARATVTSFEGFIEEHRDQIAALRILYSVPYAERLTFAAVKELANAIQRPPTAGRPPPSGRPTRPWTARRCAARARACWPTSSRWCATR